MKMMTQQVYPETNQSGNNLGDKVEQLQRSVSEVYKYELLTTNQYLKQMELVLEILDDITKQLN